LNTALYAAIWTALVLFVAGEAGKARDALCGARGWGWRAWTAGAVLCAAHMAMAMALRHGWSQQAAAAATARQTARVYGIDWAGGLYVNYAFLVVWIAEAVWWGLSPAHYAVRNAAVTWTLRSFYFVVIFNGVVIFAGPPGRIAGVLLVAGLVWTWSERGRRPAQAQEP
jgi:hypothetical protein